ncbi:hypothetical protein UPYG_G00042300 [Umbra pygmaea]|uniref:Ciliary neurotrophic factor n=1 Tax=Umbra pygmaea TaxID=75934 RepID=A0ABD0XSK1_UMBPY
MAGTRTRTRTVSELSRTARAAAIAEDLHHECTTLLELYRKKEAFSKDHTVSEERLVTVTSLSSQLSANDRVWRLYSALQQCRRLLEGVIGQEEVLGTGADEVVYESQKITVRERLNHLIDSTRRLLVDGDGTASLTPDPDNSEKLDGAKSSSPFALKLWIYRVYHELEHWTLIATKTLQALNNSTDAPKERGKQRRNRGRRTRR